MAITRSRTGLGYGPPPSATKAFAYQQRQQPVMTVAPGPPRAAPPVSGPAVMQQTRLQMPPTLTPSAGYAPQQAASPTYAPAWHPEAQNGGAPPPAGPPWPLIIAGLALAVLSSS